MSSFPFYYIKLNFGDELNIQMYREDAHLATRSYLLVFLLTAVIVNIKIIFPAFTEVLCFQSSACL